jgi:hypothetical protein
MISLVKTTYITINLMWNLLKQQPQSQPGHGFNFNGIEAVMLEGYLRD